MSSNDTATKSDKHGMTSADWTALNAMSDDDVESEARSDPDNPPLTDRQLGRMRRVSMARVVRRQLGLSVEQFALLYGIPLDTLRAWERHEAEPTAAERSYLEAIARAPEATQKPAA